MPQPAVSDTQPAPHRSGSRDGSTRSRRRPAGIGREAVTGLPGLSFDSGDGASTDGAADAATGDRKRPLAQRGIFRVTAVASVATLLGTSAIPALGLGGEDQTAAAVSQQLALDAINEDDITVIGSVSASMADSGTSFSNNGDASVQFPITEGATLTDGFGYRTAPVAQFHDGQDFAAPAGTPVRAITEGTVLEAGYAEDGCGFGLKLQHEIDGEDVKSRYCHMEFGSHSLSEGDTVSLGDEVGRVGNTGMSFGPHLHLVIEIDDKAVDPLPYLYKHNRSDAPPGTAEQIAEGGSTEEPPEDPTQGAGQPTPGIDPQQQLQPDQQTQPGVEQQPVQ